MKTKQLVIRSAVTIVATGLTLLSSGNSEASGRGPSGMRMNGARAGMNNRAIRQGISSHGLARAQGATRMIGRNSNQNATLNRGRDDRGHGRHERGDDRGGRASMINRGERERGDDHGRHRERGDDKGKGNSSITRGEREPGDDHGRHHERGDDQGGGR